MSGGRAHRGPDAAHAVPGSPSMHGPTPEVVCIGTVGSGCSACGPCMVVGSGSVPGSACGSAGFVCTGIVKDGCSAWGCSRARLADAAWIAASTVNMAHRTILQVERGCSGVIIIWHGSMPLYSSWSVLYDMRGVRHCGHYLPCHAFRCILPTLVTTVSVVGYPMSGRI